MVRRCCTWDVCSEADCCRQAVLDVDGQLRSHEPHLQYRMTQYQETKRAIEDVEGSVADFARVRSRASLSDAPRVFCSQQQDCGLRE